jgi:hypothetical protein
MDFISILSIFAPATNPGSRLIAHGTLPHLLNPRLVG